MLLARRYDAILANDMVMGQLLKARRVEDQVRSEIEKDKPLGVYFSKTFLKPDPGFPVAFDKAVPSCRGQVNTNDKLSF
ncbi:hypothetical protein [Roseibium sp.]|uniref:hypothetical protein n=1 Tax=Roseibium sp. TaxID=1936156 RepID=UPI003B526843